MAWPDWVTAHAADPTWLFVAYTDADPADIGGTYDPQAGFTAP